MKASRLFGFGVLMTALGGLIGLLPDQLSSQQGALVKMDGDDIGGVVKGASGPEAGVWVIAETTDLPTKFAKIVVTDEQGRYVIPDLPKANYDIWVRGYGLIDSPKVASHAGQEAKSKSGRGAERWRRGAVLSGDLLVLDVEDSRQERVSRHRCEGKRHAGKTATSGRMVERRQDQRLHVLPSARQQSDADDSQRVR